MAEIVDRASDRTAWSICTSLPADGSHPASSTTEMRKTYRSAVRKCSSASVGPVTMRRGADASSSQIGGDDTSPCPRGDPTPPPPPLPPDRPFRGGPFAPQKSLGPPPWDPKPPP